MKALAAYIMRGRQQAIGVVAGTAMLAFLMPLLAPLSYLSGAAVGLVTLRMGYRQGVLVILWAALAAAALGALLGGRPQVSLGLLLGLWLPVWVLAVSLRRSANLARSVLLGGLFGAMLVLAFHLMAGEPAEWWYGQFSAAMQQAEVTPSAQEMAQLQSLSRLMTGSVATALTLSLLGCLFIARWWQASLYNPGGFRQEFHELRLGRGAAVALGALLLASGAAPEPLAALAGDLLILGLVLFGLQGVAVVHWLVRRKGASVGWLVGMYLLMPLLLPLTLTLAVAGMADNWFDFRGFLGRKTDN